METAMGCIKGASLVGARFLQMEMEVWANGLRLKWVQK